MARHPTARQRLEALATAPKTGKVDSHIFKFTASM
jgi:hypothetical protein